MPRRREQPWLLLAFAAAVLAHAALVVWLVRIDRGRTDLAQRPALRVTPATAIVRVPPKRDDPPIGEKQGNGDAIARVDLPGQTTAKETHDFEQAWTRQRPSMPSPAAAQPSTPLGPIAPAPNSKTPTPKPAEKPTPSPATPAAPIAPAGSVAKPSSPPPEKPQVPADKSPPPPPSPASPPKAPDNRGEAGPSDLDPFAKADGVEFKQGCIEARTGRPVKLARPRVDLRFMADATTLSGHSVSVGLQIETDNSGAARDVRVVKSSGSEPIDDAIRLAMYESWFGGKMPDDFPFGVTLWR